MPARATAQAPLIPMEITSGTAKIDLLLSMVDSEEGLNGSLEYSTDLFNGTMIAQMVGQFEALLHAVTARPDSRLSDLEAMLAEIERQQQIVQRNRFREARQASLPKVKPRPIKRVGLADVTGPVRSSEQPVEDAARIDLGGNGLGRRAKATM